MWLRRGVGRVDEGVGVCDAQHWRGFLHRGLALLIMDLCLRHTRARFLGTAQHANLYEEDL